MKIIQADILEIKEGIVAHQVNQLDIMGGGLALQIRKKYKNLFDSYNEVCRNLGSQLYGSVQPYFVNSNLTICNLFCQRGMSRYNTTTDYELMYLALTGMVKMYGIEKDYYLPYKIGCGMANGDWKEVSRIIETVEKELNMEFYICKREAD